MGEPQELAEPARAEARGELDHARIAGLGQLLDRPRRRESRASRAASAWSRTRKRGSTPAAPGCVARRRRQKPWIVVTKPRSVSRAARAICAARSGSVSAASGSGAGAHARTRPRSSLAARSVKVKARIASTPTPSSQTAAQYSSTRVRVLPVPAPASRKTSPPRASIAASCSGVGEGIAAIVHLRRRSPPARGRAPCGRSAGRCSRWGRCPRAGGGRSRPCPSRRPRGARSPRRPRAPRRARLARADRCRPAAARRWPRPPSGRCRAARVASLAPSGW